jgi:glycosyltransferase involved in cell wall biosynthesis
MVVSHPAVLSVNQLLYAELARRGWHVELVVPSHWRSEYSGASIEPQSLPELEHTMHSLPIALAGRPQRHLYLTRPGRLARRLRAEVAFLEAEPYSLPAIQWGRALARNGIPFGVQCYENIDRPLPPPIRWLRSRLLADAAFVAARSASAARLVRAWGAAGEVELAPPGVPMWEHVPRTERDDRSFSIGYAGRLISSKGLDDLLAAVRLLAAPVELVLIGNGDLRAQLEGQEIPGGRVRVLDGLSHEQMAAGYAQLDVLVLPSHTTPTWKEQFGRVIIESLWCGVPVVGSSSGEIPWLIELTGGGRVFAEGDVHALADELALLRERPALRAELAAAGRASVERMFTVPAATDPLERMLVHALARARATGRARGGAGPSAPS